MMNVQDRVNTGVWSRTQASDWLATEQGFTDEGERHAFWAVIDEVRGQPILDLGVGPGRTIPMMRALSPHYVALDYLPEMVALARQRYPDADVQLGDARDLSRFADNSFALVAFSFMGIDAVDHAGRQRILREVHRVLRPNGIFWFSTLNKDGPAPRERPWRPHLPPRTGGWARYAFDTLRTVKAVPKNTRNYLHHRGLSQEGTGWSVAPFAAHAFGLVVHYTTLEHQLAELATAGFAPEPSVWDNDHGRRIAPGGDLTHEHSFNILARKPAG